MFQMRIEVGGADQQNAAIAILLGNLIEHSPIDMLGDQIAQGRRIRNRLGTQQTGQDLRRRHRIGVKGRPQLGEFPVIARPEKSVGSNQGAGADAGDELELRAISALRPADEKSCAERAVIGAAGQGEILHERRPAHGHHGPARHPLHTGHVRLDEGVDVLRHLVTPEADVGKAGDGGL
jgi:hypothetical protein